MIEWLMGVTGLKRKFVEYIVIGFVTVVGVGLVVWFIRAGYHKEKISSFDISQTGSAWVTAHFSKDTLRCCDEDGMPYYDTDYWTREASETWGFDSENGELKNFRMPQIELTTSADGVFNIARTPPYNKWLVTSRSFDRVSHHKNYHFKLYALNDRYSINRELYVKFLGVDKSDDFKVELDMWYDTVNDMKKLAW